MGDGEKKSGIRRLCVSAVLVTKMLEEGFVAVDALEPVEVRIRDARFIPSPRDVVELLVESVAFQEPEALAAGAAWRGEGRPANGPWVTAPLWNPAFRRRETNGDPRTIAREVPRIYRTLESTSLDRFVAVRDGKLVTGPGSDGPWREVPTA